MRIPIKIVDHVLSEFVFSPPNAVKKLDQADRRLLLDLFKSIGNSFAEFSADLELETKAAELREKLFAKVEIKPKNRLIHWITSLVKGVLNILDLRIGSARLEYEKRVYLSKMGINSEATSYHNTGIPLPFPKVTVLGELRGEFKDLWEQFRENSAHIHVIKEEVEADLSDKVYNTLSAHPNDHVYLLTNEKKCMTMLSVYRTFYYLRQKI